MIIDPYRFAVPGLTIASANVVAYLQMNGSGASFTDSGPNGLTVTANGSATQSTVSGALGGKALVCGANTSDYIGIAGNALFSLGDFTLNYKLSWPSGAAGAQIDALVDIGGYDTGISNRWAQSNDNKVSYWYKPGSTFRASGLKTIVAGTFYEVEICRSGTTIYMFFNGNLEDTLTGQSWSFAATPALRIGAVLAGGTNNYTARTFDDVMIANVALHTSAYTPRSTEFTLV